MDLGTPVVGETERVLLYWLPLGAGGRSIGWNGRLFERLVAHHEHRRKCDLYHSALEVFVADGRFIIEMAPVWANPGADHGVVREGPVGSRLLGRSAAFRYEVRRWRDGVIPDAEDARGGPLCVGRDVTRARRLVELVSMVPALTWGRDELDTGEMWNSNSVTAWLLATSGHDVETIAPPPRGRAPGWQAGLAAARAPMTSSRSGRPGSAE